MTLIHMIMDFYVSMSAAKVGSESSNIIRISNY